MQHEAASFFVTAALCLLPFAGCGALRPPPAPDRPLVAGDVKKALKGDRELAFRLYPLLSPGQGNFAYSPASLRLAFATVWAGARANTAAEVAHLLGIEGEPQPVHDAWRALAPGWTAQGTKQKGEAFTLHVANGFFSTVETQFSPEYFELMASHYGTPLVPLDLRGSAETSRLRMNEWVEKRTDGRIGELLPSGAVDTRTRLLLVNTAQFDAKWRDAFDTARTKSDEFHAAEPSKARAEFIGRRGTIAYAETPEAQVVELPYAGDNVVMDILLPRADVSVIESQLTDPKQLDAWVAALKPREVDLTLPRFQIASRHDLRDALTKLGVQEAFVHGKADFSGMNGARDLELTQVVHESVVQVTAQAGDAARPSGPSAEGTPVEVHANHPFVFVIRDRALDLLLFVGRVTDPG